MKPNPKLFISHAHVDGHIAGLLVQLLRDSFENFSEEIFCSSQRENGVDSDRKISEHIVEVIKNCRAVIVLLTAHSGKAPWVVAETTAGHSNGKKQFAVGLIANKEFLPPMLEGQFITSLTKYSEVEKLISDIAKHADAERLENLSGAINTFLARIKEVAATTVVISGEHNILLQGIGRLCPAHRGCVPLKSLRAEYEKSMAADTYLRLLADLERAGRVDVSFRGVRMRKVD